MESINRTFYFVRHGETEYNRKHIVQGRVDSPLTQKGREQADAAGRYLADVSFSACFTGGQGRQLETAERILAQNKSAEKPSIQSLSGLMEIGFGPFDGGSEAKLMQQTGRLYEKAHGVSVTPEQMGELMLHDSGNLPRISAGEMTRLQYEADETRQAESPEHLKSRMLEAFGTVCKSLKPEDSRVLIVSSGNALGSLLPALTGDHRAGYFLHHGGICVLKERDGAFSISAWDVTPSVKE